MKAHTRYTSGRAGQRDLTFPKIQNLAIGREDLIGYHSYLNWLVPTYVFGKSLRLSLLLFDKIIAETDHEDLPDRVLQGLVSQGHFDARTAHRVGDLIIPITRLVAGFGTGDLLRQPEDAFLDYATDSYLDEEYRAKGENPPELPVKALGDIRYMVTVSAFENWFALSKQLPSLFIPNVWEEGILLEFLKFLNYSETRDEARNYGKFSSVVTKLLPAIDELSVDEILELRDHEYFASFRRKTKNIVDMLGKAADADCVVEEEERNDIKILQDMFRPRPLPTLLRAVFGNLPIPTAINANPVSAFDGASAVIRDIRAARELGWLYFVRDLNEARERAKHFRTGDILGLH